MAKSDVLVRMKADTQNYNANIAKARRTLQGFVEDNLSAGGAIKQLTSNLVSSAAQFASIAGAVTAVSVAIKDAVTQGLEMAKAGEGVRMAFDRLNRPDLLDNLREATHGTVTDLELMKQAVKFNDFKLNLDEMGTLLAFAQQKAKDTGQSVDYMVDSIVTGLGRQSLMILDNLGLSAAEIRERMKETGDMTKAVASIIKDQMAQAGEYVETAADKATKAEVDLNNAMEALGRTLLPLQEQGTSLFNTIEIGAINALNKGVAPLVPAMLGLKDAIGGIYDTLSNSTVLDGFIDWLETGVDITTRFVPLLSMLRSLMNYGGEDVGAGAAIGGSVGALMGDNTVKSIPEITVTGTKGENAKGGKSQSLPSYGDFGKQLSRSLSDTSSLKEVSEQLSPYAMMLDEIKSKILDVQDADLGNALEIPDMYVENLIKMKKEINSIVKSASITANVVGSIGDAFNSIEDPAAKVAGTVMQAIASVALGYAQATVQATTMGPWAWIAFAAAGLATMLTMISSIHSATGYAQGGIVDGKSYSGDNIPIMANAGELVLNKSMQNNLANALYQNGGGNMSMTATVRGEQIILVADRTLRRQGKGELLTIK